MRTAATLALLAFAAGCATLPPLDPRPASAVLDVPADTTLGRALQPFVAAHPGRTGIYPLVDGMESYAARLALFEAAQRTLDVQYYIWHADVSGTLLFDALQDAADRGVRVRLLLDDNNTPGLDAILAALDAHPSIEVRLFNPFANRRWRAAGYLTDFRRLNRRMHNKSLTADGQATIVGGRNIGDEYFAGGPDFTFADLDVIAIGPAVAEVVAEFDRYWSSASSYPAGRIVRAAPPGTAVRITHDALRLRAAPANAVYAEPYGAEMLAALRAGRVRFEWAPARLVSDDPGKVLGRAEGDALLFPRLEAFMGEARREFDLVSPYFVPRRAGVAALLELEKAGVRVRVLTNALEATDVPAVHAGYARRREPLLKGGVELYELKRSAANDDLGRAFGGRGGGRVGGRGSGSGSGSGGGARRQEQPDDGDRGITGSPGTSLHAKTFAIDRSRVFVGSFNFDPRSALLNTEMGLVIESPALAAQITELFDVVVPTAAYEVRRRPLGTIEWVERRGDETIVHRGEPGTSWFLRFTVWLMSLLPIEGLL